MLISTAIGSSLAMVLRFGNTVLSVKGWKNHIIFTNSNAGKRQEQSESNITFMSNNVTESKSQSLVQVKLSEWNGLINKRVLTCEMIDIGYISTVENQFMTIIGSGAGRRQEYVISTYYVRAHDHEKVLIDTSVRYLDRYQVKETT